MRFLFVTVTALFLAACNSAPVKNIQDVNTETTLQTNIDTPVNMEIAYYAKHRELTHVLEYTYAFDRKAFHTGEQFSNALELTFNGMFTQARPLHKSTKPAYIFSFSAKPEFDRFFGSTSVTLDTKVIDRSGNEVFHTTVEASARSSFSKDYDQDFKNAYAKAIKESVTQFLNNIGAQKLTHIANQKQTELTRVELKSVLQDSKPASIGTGFFINNTGKLLTAGHIINSCLLIKVKDQNTVYDASVHAKSRILNIAVLDTLTDRPNDRNKHAKLAADNDIFAEQKIFTTSYPVINAFLPKANIKNSQIYAINNDAGSLQSLEYLAKGRSGTSGGPVITYDGKLAGIAIHTTGEGALSNTSKANQPRVNQALTSKQISKFLLKNDVNFVYQQEPSDYETATADAVDYTTRILCYR